MEVIIDGIAYIPKATNHEPSDFTTELDSVKSSVDRLSAEAEKIKAVETALRTLTDAIRPRLAEIDRTLPEHANAINRLERCRNLNDNSSRINGIERGLNDVGALSAALNREVSALRAELIKRIVGVESRVDALMEPKKKPPQRKPKPVPAKKKAAKAKRSR